jgi:dTDP-4-amino-4,6-dideoxygalactose transaminase
MVSGDRGSFLEHLRRLGVIAGIHYPTLIPDQGALRSYTTVKPLGPLTKANEFANREVSLPIHPFLSVTEVERVIEACNSWRR